MHMLLVAVGRPDLPFLGSVGVNKHGRAELFCHNFTDNQADHHLLQGDVAEQAYQTLEAGCKAIAPGNVTLEQRCLRGAQMVAQFQATPCKSTMSTHQFHDWRTNNCHSDVLSNTTACKSRSHHESNKRTKPSKKTVKVQQLMTSVVPPPGWMSPDDQCQCKCDGCKTGICDCGSCDCSQGGCQNCQCCTYADDDDASDDGGDDGGDDDATDDGSDDGGDTCAAGCPTGAGVKCSVSVAECAVECVGTFGAACAACMIDLGLTCCCCGGWSLGLTDCSWCEGG